MCGQLWGTSEMVPEMGPEYRGDLISGGILNWQKCPEYRGVLIYIELGVLNIGVPFFHGVLI